MGDFETGGPKNEKPIYERLNDPKEREEIYRTMKMAGVDIDNPDEVSSSLREREEHDIQTLTNRAMRENGISDQVKACKLAGGGECYDELMKTIDDGKTEIAAAYYEQKDEYLKKHVEDSTAPFHDDDGADADEELSSEEKLKTLQFEVSQSKEKYTDFMTKAVADHDQAMANAIPLLQKSEKEYNKCLDLNQSVEKFAVEHGFQFQCFDDMEKTYVQSTLLYDKITEKYKDDGEKMKMVMQQFHDIRDALFDALQKYNEVKEAAEKALKAEEAAYVKLSGPEQQGLYNAWQHKEKLLRDYKKQQR